MQPFHKKLKTENNYSKTNILGMVNLLWGIFFLTPFLLVNGWPNDEQVNALRVTSLTASAYTPMPCLLLVFVEDYSALP